MTNPYIFMTIFQIYMTISTLFFMKIYNFFRTKYFCMTKTFRPFVLSLVYTHESISALSAYILNDTISPTTTSQKFCLK